MGFEGGLAPPPPSAYGSTPILPGKSDREKKTKKTVFVKSIVRRSVPAVTGMRYVLDTQCPSLVMIHWLLSGIGCCCNTAAGRIISTRAVVAHDVHNRQTVFSLLL